MLSFLADVIRDYGSRVRIRVFDYDSDQLRGTSFLSGDNYGRPME